MSVHLSNTNSNYNRNLTTVQHPKRFELLGDFHVASWNRKRGIHRDTLIRCPYAFPQLCLVERCGEEESTAGMNYSLSLNPRATYRSWAYNADRSLGTTANPGSARLMTIGLSWQVPLQSGTSITCHENIVPLRWLHQQLLRVLDWEENQRDLIHLKMF